MAVNPSRWQRGARAWGSSTCNLNDSTVAELSVEGDGPLMSLAFAPMIYTTMARCTRKTGICHLTVVYIRRYPVKGGGQPSVAQQVSHDSQPKRYRNKPNGVWYIAARGEHARQHFRSFKSAVDVHWHATCLEHLVGYHPRPKSPSYSHPH